VYDPTNRSRDVSVFIAPSSLSIEGSSLGAALTGE